MTISSDPKSCLNTLTYSRFKLDCKKWVSHSTKGQLISKSNCHVVILPRDEQMKSFSVLCDVFPFVFWKALKTPKNLSKLPDL